MENEEIVPESSRQEPEEQEQEQEPKQQLTDKQKKQNKIAMGIVGGVMVLFLLSVLLSNPQNSADTAEKDRQIAELQVKVDELQSEADELSAKVAAAQPWFEMSEAEQKAMEDQLAAQKAEEEAKAAEEAAAAMAAQAEAEKIGYETGITYDQLARTPDDYKLKKVKFTGKVIQVMEGSKEINIRLAVKSNYDTILLGAYDPGIVSSRVLEDDIVTIYGVSGGLYTYESTMGGNITIPLVVIDKIDQ